MDDRQPDPHFEDFSSAQRSGTANHSFIRGNFSAISGSNNNITGDTHNYYDQRGTNWSQNYTEIMKCLYTSEYESHRRRVASPAEGTCIWVTEHPKYEAWLKETSGLLWLSADPGCGKSVIASFLVEHLGTRPDTVVCYFFFKDDNEEQKSAAFALSAILHQLFGKREPLWKYAQEQLKKKGEVFTKEVDALWNILVDAAADQGCGDVICVVDGLDECEKATRDQLIGHMTAFARSQTSSTPLKFLTTGRPYHEIEILLGSGATIRLRGEDEVKAITTDVTHVINKSIGDLESHWREDLGYLRDLLIASADRTFLWVSLVLEILRDCEEGSRQEFTKIASTAPGDLGVLYTKILRKSKDPEKARKTLHIVAAAARPLTLSEMYAAFSIREGDTAIGTIQDLGDLPPKYSEVVKNRCGLFIRIIGSKVYLVHQTAKEFLVGETTASEGEWRHTLSPMKSNFILADICITYLSLANFGNDQLPISTFSNVTRGAIQAHFQKHTLLDYAASHWADHFRDSQDRQKELLESTRLICEGGSIRFLVWLKVYWENSARDRYRLFPKDFTHLMIASWLGQRTVVEQLLMEGGDINVRSKHYGTALNIAALWEEDEIAEMLLRKDARVCLGGKMYNISETRSNLGEAEELVELMLPVEEWEEEERERLADELLLLAEGEIVEFLDTLNRGTPTPHTPDPHTPDSHTPAPRAPNPHTFDPQTPEPHTPDLQTPDPHTPDPHTPDPHTPDPQTPDPHTPNPHTPGPHTPNPHTPARRCRTCFPKGRPWRWIKDL